MLQELAPILESYGRDPEVTRYLTWKPLQSLKESEKAVWSSIEGWRKRLSFSWAVLLKQDGALVGTVSLLPQGPRLNVGFIVARPYWGRG